MDLYVRLSGFMEGFSYSDFINMSFIDLKAILKASYAIQKERNPKAK
jgi:hypothetical protein